MRRILTLFAFLLFFLMNGTQIHAQSCTTDNQNCSPTNDQCNNGTPECQTFTCQPVQPGIFRCKSSNPSPTPTITPTPSPACSSTNLAACGTCVQCLSLTSGGWSDQVGCTAGGGPACPAGFMSWYYSDCNVNVCASGNPTGAPIPETPTPTAPTSIGTCTYLPTSPGSPVLANSFCAAGYTPKAYDPGNPTCECVPVGSTGAIPPGQIANPPTPTIPLPTLPPFEIQRCRTDSNPQNPNSGVMTALGCIDVWPTGFITKLFVIILSLSGGIALLLIIFSGYRMIIAAGNPEGIQGARETMTAAIVGLLFIIFSFVILEVIAGNILRIPGFGQ